MAKNGNIKVMELKRGYYFEQKSDWFYGFWSWWLNSC